MPTQHARLTLVCVLHTRFMNGNLVPQVNMVSFPSITVRAKTLFNTRCYLSVTIIFLAKRQPRRKSKVEVSNGAAPPLRKVCLPAGESGPGLPLSNRMSQSDVGIPKRRPPDISQSIQCSGLRVRAPAALLSQERPQGWGAVLRSH